MKRYLLSLFLVLLALIVVIAGPVVRFYTDFLWFKSLRYIVIFTTIFISRVMVGILLGLFFFIIFYGNLKHAKRNLPPLSIELLEHELFKIGVCLARRAFNLLLFLGSLIVALMVGMEASTHWEKWLLYLNPVLFGKRDPVFNKDISFYVFCLPLFGYLYKWLFFTLLVTTVVVLAVYLSGRAIVIFRGRFQIISAAGAHLNLLISLLFFLKAWGYRLEMYRLLFTRGSLLDGAGYTEVSARLPALWILLITSLIGGLVILYGIRQKRVTYPVTCIAGLLILSLVVGIIYPASVQQFSVAPNELQKQTPFIKRAIEATCEAYGLNTVKVLPFEAEAFLTLDQIEANRVTIQNIRLWDQNHLLSAYAQIQTIQQYYQFKDIDVDRYWLSIDSNQKDYRQVWLSARELNQSLLPQQSQTWINRHLTYTHGYGFCMSPVNEISSEGLPNFLVYDIPPKTKVRLPIKKMGLYFGEATDTYALVKTSALEFDYPAGPETKHTTYEGESGVNIGNFFRKLLFSIRFSDLNILLNENLQDESRILYQRNIEERIKLLFPFLKFDQDPYLVTAYGNLYWIWDAYTTTPYYPYSKQIQGWSSRLNYIRNSIKIVIDAYTGDVDAYVIQKPLRDPLIEAYQKIFPHVFKPVSEMPEEIRSHLRYPEDLFRIQTAIFSRYHMDDPTVFYNNSDLWDIPAQAELIAGESQPMEPYYIIMKLPGGQREEFILMLPFIRAGKLNMVSWMCAKCDEPDYGRLIVYQFPKDKNVFGPQQVAARARQDTQISEQLTLWSQQGSEVGSGNLLVIPIESSILYVMPVYLQSTSAKIPELKRVIVALGDKVSMAQNLNEALASVVGSPPSLLNVPRGISSETQPGIPYVQEKEEVSRLVNQALSEYSKAQELLKKGDWAGYGEQIKALEQTLKKLQAEVQ